MDTLRKQLKRQQQKSKIITEALLGITSNSILVYQAYFRKEPKMKKSLTLILLVCALLAVAVFTGCKKKGPMEKAGKAVDKAAQKTSDAVKDAVDDTKDAVKDK
jgi:predicted small lipoprotein YifL